MDVKNKITQRAKILEILEKRGSTTVRELFNEGINSPTKRLSELRAMGLIREEWDFKLKEDGRKVRFKRYFLNDNI